MTAIQTAAAVLTWAEEPGEAWLDPPAGGLEHAGKLAAPGSELHDQIQLVAASAAARLGAGVPPFGDDGPVGLGVLFLAAAVGGRTDAEIAARLIAAAPPLPITQNAGPAAPHHADTPARGWADAIARHAVVAAFIASDQARGSGVQAGGSRAAAELIEGLLGASPLTAILLRPPLGVVDARTVHLRATLRLIAHPRGRLVLIGSLARPTINAQVLTWRGWLLSELLAGHRDLVMEVYVAARLRHGPEWDGLIGLTEHAPRPSGGSAALGFWAPLAVIDKQDPALLRSQLFLDGGHRRAVDLAGRYVTTFGPVSAR